MLIKALTTFSDGVTSMWEGEVKDIPDEYAEDFVAEGLAEEYTEPVTPSGTITITQNANGIDVAEYAEADVNVSSQALETRTATLINGLGVVMRYSGTVNDAGRAAIQRDIAVNGSATVKCLMKEETNSALLLIAARYGDNSSVFIPQGKTIQATSSRFQAYPEVLINPDRQTFIVEVWNVMNNDEITVSLVDESPVVT